MRHFDDEMTKCLFGHIMPTMRVQWHEAKCIERKQWLANGKKIFVCPYMYMHQFLGENDYNYHISVCSYLPKSGDSIEKSSSRI
jgi:hypothetical protein